MLLPNVQQMKRVFSFEKANRRLRSHSCPLSVTGAVKLVYSRIAAPGQARNAMTCGPTSCVAMESAIGALYKANNNFGVIPVLEM